MYQYHIQKEKAGPYDVSQGWKDCNILMLSFKKIAMQSAILQSCSTVVVSTSAPKNGTTAHKYTSPPNPRPNMKHANPMLQTQISTTTYLNLKTKHP
jgi:hypothetical protein